MTVITPIGSIGENELSRAIQLELSLKGHEAEISENDANTRIFVMKTLDEKNADIIKNSKAENKICCFFENTTAIPEDSVSAIRPFLLKNFCELIVKLQKGISESPLRDIVIESRFVKYGNERVSLSKKELELFTLLYENRGKALSREEIAKTLWDNSDTNIIDVYIRYLRKKLDERFDKKLIVTIRNKGYMLR